MIRVGHGSFSNTFPANPTTRRPRAVSSTPAKSRTTGSQTSRCTPSLTTRPAMRCLCCNAHLPTRRRAQPLFRGGLLSRAAVQNNSRAYTWHTTCGRATVIRCRLSYLRRAGPGPRTILLLSIFALFLLCRSTFSLWTSLLFAF